MLGLVLLVLRYKHKVNKVFALEELAVQCMVHIGQ